MAGGPTGHPALAWLGVVVAGLGQLAFLIAVIAVGVRLGIGWSGLLDPAPGQVDGPDAAPSSYLDEDGR